MEIWNNIASVASASIYSDNGKLKILRGAGKVLDIVIASNMALVDAGIYDRSSELNIGGIEIKGNRITEFAPTGIGAGVLTTGDHAAITRFVSAAQYQ